MVRFRAVAMARPSSPDRAGMNTENSQTLPSRQRTHGDAAAARRWKKWVILIFVVITIAAVGNAYLVIRRPTLPNEVNGVTVYNNLSNEVVDGPVDYDIHPPVGGPHAALPQLCGFYRVPVADENIVASLATGAVWIAHQPGLSGDDYDTLLDIAHGQYDVLLTPYPGLEHKFVLTAWGRQLALDDVHDSRVDLFVNVYQNRDWAPNVDDTCAEGLGLPLPTRTSGR
jgi:hypothetical protein